VPDRLAVHFVVFNVVPRNQNTQRTCGTFDLQRSQQFSGPIFVQDAEWVSRDRQLRRRGDPAMIDPRVKLRPEPAPA
jgi:hypothetical protein